MWLVVLGLLILLFASRKEGFSFEMKTDFGTFDGLPNLATAATNHVKHLHNVAWEYVPFRSHLRALRRQMRRRNFSKG